MSSTPNDVVTDPQEDPQAGEPQEQDNAEPKTFNEDYVRKLRAEAAKYRTKAQENAEAAQRLNELEEAQKTEAQKQAEALETAQRELDKYKHREQVSQWASEIVQDEKFKGIPAAALKGSTKEELEAHAEVLLPLITPQKQDAAQPVSTIGNTPRHSGNIPISEQIAAAEASGNKQLVAALKAMQLSNS